MPSDHFFEIGSHKLGDQHPTYFIADIAANHDGDVQRAKELIWLAKEAGANCAKFQHFEAKNIVSDIGFKKLNSNVSHQSDWKKSVFDIYDQYHTRRDWSEELVSTCEAANIDFMTTPYDIEAVKLFEPYLHAFKVGSGDITFRKLLEVVSMSKKPVFLATGASTLQDVKNAVAVVEKYNNQICLMQCNTNYTGSEENFHYVNLNVLKRLKEIWPDYQLGLSDHTPGHASVLGAIALGARAVEKHFTDDNNRIGPDHSFALNPVTWKEMIERSRELEASLGDGIKRVEKNENETVIIQRRAIRVSKALEAGHTLSADDVCMLRPCPPEAISPMYIDELIGKKLLRGKEAGAEIFWQDIQ